MDEAIQQRVAQIAVDGRRPHVRRLVGRDDVGVLVQNVHRCRICGERRGADRRLQEPRAARLWKGEGRRKLAWRALYRISIFVDLAEGLRERGLLRVVLQAQRLIEQWLQDRAVGLAAGSLPGLHGSGVVPCSGDTAEPPTEPARATHCDAHLRVYDEVRAARLHVA